MLVVAQDLRADPVVRVAEDGVILVPLLVALLHKVLRAALLDTVQQAALVPQPFNPAAEVVPAKQAIPTDWDSAATVDLTRYQAPRLFMQVEAVEELETIRAVMVAVVLVQGDILAATDFRALLIAVAEAVVVIKPMVVLPVVAQVVPA